MASPRLCLWRFSSWRLAITLVSLVARGCHADLRASKRYAWALHFYDDAYAQQGLTAVASLVLTRTRADIVVFGLGLSNATHSALTVMGPKIRMVRKAREQAVACPHKVIRSSSQRKSQPRLFEGIRTTEHGGNCGAHATSATLTPDFSKLHRTILLALALSSKFGGNFGLLFVVSQICISSQNYPPIHHTLRALILQSTPYSH